MPDCNTTMTTPSLRIVPRGTCPDCQQPVSVHLDSSGCVDLGCPKEGMPQYLRQLAASAHIETLANVLATAHWRYEGWEGLVIPLGGEQKRIYEQAAQTAVRFCSEADRQVATDRAVSVAQITVGQYMTAPFNGDSKADAEAISRAIRQALDVYWAHLMNGCSLSSYEIVEMSETVEAEDSHA